MKLKNFLIVVNDAQKSLRFYKDVFGLELLVDNHGNMVLTDGLVLQERSFWREFLKRDVITHSNSAELYFEEEDVDAFVQKLNALYPNTRYVNPPMTHDWGQRVVRFYDPDGNLIEVGSPM